MLFQEKASKELLERNSRREGPIYEGDESIMWGFMDSAIEDESLIPLSLSRLVNDNWLKKGKTSQAIIMYSFKKLQKSYIRSRYAFSKGGSHYKIFPNSLQDKTFIDFHTVMLAMNARHAFYVNNRKYYFNAIESRFEPIYYDGNPNFLEPLQLEKVDEELVPYLPSIELIQSMLGLNKNNKLLKSSLFRKITINKNNF